MKTRNTYDILIDLNRELGKQEILTLVLRDLSTLSYTEKYKVYEQMLEDSKDIYTDLNNEYNNTINNKNNEHLSKTTQNPISHFRAW